MELEQCHAMRIPHILSTSVFWNSS